MFEAQEISKSSPVKQLSLKNDETEKQTSIINRLSLNKRRGSVFLGNIVNVEEVDDEQE